MAAQLLEKRLASFRYIESKDLTLAASGPGDGKVVPLHDNSADAVSAVLESSVTMSALDSSMMMSSAEYGGKEYTGFFVFKEDFDCVYEEMKAMQEACDQYLGAALEEADVNGELR